MFPPEFAAPHARQAVRYRMLQQLLVDTSIMAMAFTLVVDVVGRSRRAWRAVSSIGRAILAGPSRAISR